MNSQTLERITEYPNFRQCSIQTFNDQDKNERRQSGILPMTNENLEKCVNLQSVMPYGIYFSVNPMKTGKRNAESVEFIQTWICDIDSGSKAEQLKLIENAPLKPTFVVESVHGFHLYYFAENHLTKEQFEEGNLWLMEYYHWDIKVCKDIARVLRIPWFYHMKWEPVMVEFRKDLSGFSFYSVEEMTKAFPKKEEEIKKPEIKPIPKNTYNCSDSYWEKVNRLDNRQMLRELSGTRWVDWEIIDFKRNWDWTEQITINWTPRSCWIDECWMIGSYDNGWPSYIQWLQYYKKRKFTTSEWHEFSNRLNANHPELEEKKKNKDVVKQVTQDAVFNPTAVPKLVKPDFSWGTKLLDDHLWKMKKWQLVILLGETWAGKTTFATFMARKNKGSCYYVLEDSVENIASRYAMKRAWITVEQYNEWTWTKIQEEDYERAYLSFKNRDIKMVNIWKKIDVDALMDSIREMKEAWHSLFFIDNLWFIVGSWASEAEQTADVSSKLLSLCLQENICVVLLHHFKKKSSTIDKRDISQMRWSWKLWDDAFMVVEYMRDDTQTFLKVYKDRTWGELKIYEIKYDRGEYEFLEAY